MSTDTELPADVLTALQSGKKIEAIKCLREHRNIGLKEAKDIVDTYVAGLPPSTANRYKQSDSGVGRLLFAGAVLAIAYYAYRHFL
jgi:ribosomal protein L7/L12